MVRKWHLRTLLRPSISPSTRCYILLLPCTVGSQLRVKMTLIPRDSYTLPYYRDRTRYRSGISDSKYLTTCSLSFDAIPVYDSNRRAYNYYKMAGVGILLLGAATYVSSKRRVSCLCDVAQDEDDDAVVKNDYQSHTELPISRRPASKKKTDHTIESDSSILTF